MSGFPHGLELQHFSPSEFDHPDRVDPELLELLDEVRARCGFPIGVTSDARTEGDLIDIYGSLDDAPDSPHQVRDDGWAHAVDVKPAGALEFSEFHTRKMTIACTAFWMGPTRMGVWPRQGVEVGTSHVHLDNDTKLRRPYYWGAKSK